MPWVADAQITLTVANSALTAATQLDINSNSRTKLKTTVQGQAVRLHLPEDALYVVLEAKWGEGCRRMIKMREQGETVRAGAGSVGSAPSWVFMD
jgi:hypothetical protein